MSTTLRPFWPSVRRHVSLPTRVGLVATAICLTVPVTCSAQASETGAEAEASESLMPERYSLDYPEADRFCPPLRSTFFEVTRTQMFVNGKRFRQKPNGGFGLPVIDKIGDQNLIHLGADLGWHQVGAPVFAIADGVVRLSTGPPLGRKSRQRGGSRPDPLTLTWGNLVVIEHRLPDGQFFTSVYGHLGPKRLVQIGDVVKAGDVIGDIGRQRPDINGGYKPHLHFGIREGRNIEVGATLAMITIGARPMPIKATSLTETEFAIDLPENIPDGTVVNVGGVRHAIKTRDGKRWLPAKILWSVRRPDFQILGYDLKTVHWKDPIKFLREHRADTAPAPFRFGNRR